MSTDGHHSEAEWFAIARPITPDGEVQTLPEFDRVAPNATEVLSGLAWDIEEREEYDAWQITVERRTP